MKSPAAYYLVLLYFTVMIRPLAPFIEDEWAHQFNDIEHVLAVHAKYGSNHLQKELSATTSDDKNKNQSSLKSEDQVSFHLPATEQKCHVFILTPGIKYNPYQLNSLPVICLSNQGPPPKIA